MLLIPTYLWFERFRAEKLLPGFCAPGNYSIVTAPKARGAANFFPNQDAPTKVNRYRPLLRQRTKYIVGIAGGRRSDGSNLWCIRRA
jgi:hypothetical protein